MDTTTLSQVLRSEVEKIKTDVLEALDICSVTEFDDPDKLHAIEVLAEHLEHIGDAADVIEFTGVKEICTFMNDSLLEFVAGDQNTRHEWKIFYGRNIDLLLDYLNAPAEPHICDQLVTHIATAPTPLSDDNLLLLKELLLNIPQLSVTTSLGEDISLLEDISLDIPEHVDPVLFESFLQEALHNVAELNAITQRLGDGKYTYEEIELARRISHTLKGSASIVGIRGIATLSHYIEDIFQLLDNDALQPPSDFFTTLLDASECLAHMVDYLMGQEEAPTNVHTVLTEISSWTRHLSTDNSEAQHIDVIDSTIGVTVLPESVMEPNALPALFNSQPSTNNSPNASQPRREPTLRVSIQTLNELFRLLNEMSMKIGYLGERLEQTIQRSKGLLTQNSRVSKRVSELENVVGLRGFSVAPIHGISSTTDYDPLEMDRYSEVYCTTRSLIEEVTDAREIGVSLDEDINSLSSLLAQQERANKDLQYYLLSARMTSIESIVPRLVRNVKQTCRSIGKRAELTITGADIQIDTELLNKLSDPLLHILRNAVDHGIESAEERRLQNKPDVGNISLTFERYGQSILVRCQDDGRGLDYSAIRMKAIQKGLITPDQNLSQSELARLILLPGFSTREHITEVSGRGIGMDVVRDYILSMKGTIDIKSENKKGCLVELRLPVSLVVMQALLVRNDDKLYAIPNYSLEQVIGQGMADFVTIGKEINLKYDKTAYPCRTLNELLGTNPVSLTIKELEKKYILLIRSDDEIVAVVTDQVQDNRDLLVRGLGNYVKKVKGILGLSILGSGTVVPVLDMPELLRTPIPIRVQLPVHEPVLQALTNTPKPRNILVVDDSLTVRKSLARLIENAGYAVRSARDGVEAIEMMQNFQPDLVLTDLEMPNLNGLGLTSFVRSNESTKGLPVIMITSRAMNKHRQQAKQAGVDVFLTKPYLEKELLGYIQNSFEKEFLPGAMT